MIVDVDLVVFNCVFSRALDLNLCYIKDIISHIIVHIILFFEKKAPGRPGGFTQDAALFIMKRPQSEKTTAVSFIYRRFFVFVFVCV